MNDQFIDADNRLLAHAWEASGQKPVFVGGALEKRELCFLRPDEPPWELKDTINN